MWIYQTALRFLQQFYLIYRKVNIMTLFMCLQNVMQVNGAHDVKSSVQNDASHATNTLVIAIHVKLEIMEISVI